MLKILIFAFSVGTALTISSLAYSRNNDPIIYEFKGDIPPIKLTFSDLDRFLRDLQHLYATVPENVESDCTYELAGPKGSISAHSIDEVLGDDRLLTFANEFRLDCFNRRLFVHSINITLGHYSRWEIKGTDRVLLESVRSHLENFGQANRTYLGGSVPQIIALTFCLLLAFNAAPLLAGKFLIPEVRKGQENVLILISIGALFLVSILLMTSRIPEFIFPTVAIYIGTASYLERYSAEISFWGLIISLLLAILFWRRPVAPVTPKVEALPVPPKDGI